MIVSVKVLELSKSKAKSRSTSLSSCEELNLPVPPRRGDDVILSESERGSAWQGQAVLGGYGYGAYKVISGAVVGNAASTTY